MKSTQSFICTSDTHRFGAWYLRGPGCGVPVRNCTLCGREQDRKEFHDKRKAKIERIIKIKNKHVDLFW